MSTHHLQIQSNQTARFRSAFVWIGVLFVLSTVSRLHASCGDYLSHVEDSRNGFVIEFEASTMITAQAESHRAFGRPQSEDSRIPCIHCGDHLPTQPLTDGIGSEDSRMWSNHHQECLLESPSIALRPCQSPLAAQLGFPREIERPPC